MAAFLPQCHASLPPKSAAFGPDAWAQPNLTLHPARHSSFTKNPHLLLRGKGVNEWWVDIASCSADTAGQGLRVTPIHYAGDSHAQGLLVTDCTSHPFSVLPLTSTSMKSSFHLLPGTVPLPLSLPIPPPSSILLFLLFPIPPLRALPAPPFYLPTYPSLPQSTSLTCSLNRSIAFCLHSLNSLPNAHFLPPLTPLLAHFLSVMMDTRVLLLPA